jgi:hypothetical protein
VDLRTINISRCTRRRRTRDSLIFRMSTGECFHGVWAVRDLYHLGILDAEGRRIAKGLAPGEVFESFPALIKYLWDKVIDPEYVWGCGGQVVRFFPYRSPSDEPSDKFAELYAWVDTVKIPNSREVDTEDDKIKALQFCADKRGKCWYGGPHIPMPEMAARLWADRPATGIVIDNSGRKEMR